MTSEDPNFPQEIPPIPERQDDAASPSPLGMDDSPGKTPAETWDTDQWTDATDSGNPDDIAPGLGTAGDDSAPAFRDYGEGGREIPDAASADDPAVVASAAAQGSIPRAQAPGAADSPQRQAEKTVAANNTFDDWGQSEVPYQPKQLGIIDQLLLLLADGAEIWRRGLRWGRSQLPSTWQRRLSDEVMTAIALGVLVLFLALWNPLGGDKAPSTAAEQSPPPAEQPQKPVPEAPSPDAETPELAPAPGISALPDTTPEQSLIADIQDKVSNISRAYAAGLIQSVEVNLPANRLMVNLGENWYGLLDGQQDEVAQSIFEQVQQLDFKTLQLKDPDGVIVARNPVVGNTMVILHRSRAAETDLLVS